MTRAELKELVEDLHEYSALEVLLKGDDKELAIWQTINASDYVTTLRIEGKLVAAGGVVKGSLMSGRGIAWAVMTNAAQEHPFTFIRKSREQLKLAKAQYGELECLANVKFPTTEKWMRLLHFERNKLTRIGAEVYAHMLYRGP